MPTQRLTLHLDGITAGDYLAWCTNPEPAGRPGLRSVTVDCDPLGDVLVATLDWDLDVPPVHAAAAAAGLQLTADVRALEACETCPEAELRLAA